MQVPQFWNTRVKLLWQSDGRQCGDVGSGSMGYCFLINVNNDLRSYTLHLLELTRMAAAQRQDIGTIFEHDALAAE
jgi:hypothetical protein